MSNEDIISDIVHTNLDWDDLDTPSKNRLIYEICNKILYLNEEEGE